MIKGSAGALPVNVGTLSDRTGALPGSSGTLPTSSGAVLAGISAFMVSLIEDLTAFEYRVRSSVVHLLSALSVVSTGLCMDGPEFILVVISMGIGYRRSATEVIKTATIFSSRIVWGGPGLCRDAGENAT
jgi:hypothetical protein